MKTLGAWKQASGAAREELEAALAETDAPRDRCDKLGE
jgi:hypothetical protein